jgi:NAD(P)-dependent dehydrogenase (short-subunit alcohol dehydrogenase family)
VGSVLVNKLASLDAKVAAIDIYMKLSEQQNIKVYQCDITNREHLRQTADLIREQLGHPTILINNAGYVIKGGICDVPPENVQKIFDVNILSHFWTIREFLPSMKEHKRGHIVTVASAMG